MARRKSTFDDLFDTLYEMTEWFWQVGVVVITLLLILAYCSYGWVGNIIFALQESRLLSGVADKFGSFLYLLPLMILVIAILFAIKAFSTYQKNKSYL